VNGLLFRRECRVSQINQDYCVEEQMADRVQKAVNSNCNISSSELVIIGTVVMKILMMIIMIISFMF